MSGEHILVIEDEEDIAQLLEYNLVRDNYLVELAYSGRSGLNKVRERPPDLILLDLMLPEMNGLEVCRALKNDHNTKHIPIIMLTARDEEADVVTGLELGADDYVSKPFSPRVLTARIRAVLRRYDSDVAELPLQDEWISIGPLEISAGRHQATLNGEELRLTNMEFKLLHALASRPGWVFSRDQIVTAIRGENYVVTDRAVDVLLVGLRKKLGTHSAMIETVRGVGYRFQEI